MTMNLFFGPAGRRFDSDAAQLERNHDIADRQLERLRMLPIDTVLQTLANIYTLGIADGIGDHQCDYRVRTEELHRRLILALNNLDSVEFLAMDQAISEIVTTRNEVEDVYDLELDDAIALEKEDLFRAYVRGWVQGKQGVLFQIRKNEMVTFDDAWLYRTCLTQAREQARALDYDDLSEANVQRNYGERLLRVLNDSINEVEFD